jgi:hypothetical protein
MEDATQSPGNGRTGVEKIDVDTARPIVAGGGCLLDPTILARPADPPTVHLGDALGPLLAQELRQGAITQAATRFERVIEMMKPVVGHLAPDRGRHRHLRHHGRASASDEAAVGEQHAASGASRLDRRIHPGRSRADDQDVGMGLHRLWSGRCHDRPLRGTPLSASLLPLGACAPPYAPP